MRHTSMITKRAARLAVPLSLAALAGCATITETTQQQVLVQTVQDNREVFGVGCVLSNDVGKWFVSTPGRIMLQKSRAPLRVDCRKDGGASTYEKINSKNTSLWANVLFTAGAGYLVDRDTGAGYNYPNTLTIVLQSGPPPAAEVPPPGVTVY